jgi:hypothetical protein
MKKIFVFCFSLLLISCNSTQNNKKNIIPSSWDTAGKKVFVFDPKKYTWAVYDKKGSLVKSGKASGGKNYCPDLNESCRTVIGTYQVNNKKGAHCKSSQFPIKANQESGGAAMPYCMYFHEGYAIHGANNVFRKHTSHGCIHVSKQDAKWLHEKFIDIGTTIIVLPYS